MQKKTPGSPATKAQRVKPEIYADIVHRILTGELSGKRLTEERLAADYRVSRTPIREVLFALEKIGLIKHSRFRGATVTSFGPDDLEQIFDVREVLERLAVGRAVQNLKLQDLIELERRIIAARPGNSPNWKQEQAALDLEMHQMIATHCENALLISYLENITLLTHWQRVFGYHDDRFALETREEHLAVVRALLRRDAALSEQLLGEHIRAAKQRVVEQFFGNKAAPAQEAETSAEDEEKPAEIPLASQEQAR